MENNGGTILFANGDILHASNIKVEQPPKEDNKEFSRSFSFSFRDYKPIMGELLKMFLDARRAKGLRYPRKKKKALKKLMDGNWKCRTKLMNKH